MLDPQIVDEKKSVIEAQLMIYLFACGSSTTTWLYTEFEVNCEFYWVKI